MIPVIALVGRPNVGKSTLFNRLTKSRDALVANFSGLTRDRQYGDGVFQEHKFFVIDTGGLSGEERGVEAEAEEQSFIAVEEANLVFLLVDAKAGLLPNDIKIIDIVNKIAPEHLELNVKNYKSFIPKIKNSGSICLGKYAVMAMTDYNIGSNHILPTNGSAKYSSGISVNEFYKRISYINLSKKGIESLGPSVITLANYEGLAGHAQSVKKRIRRK